MKKVTVSIFLAAAMLATSVLPAFAAVPGGGTGDFGGPGIVRPMDHDVWDINLNIEGQYRTEEFSTSSDGDALRYWYSNQSDNNATVKLYKKGFFGGWNEVSSLTVTPGNAWHTTYYNAANADYYISVTAETGKSQLKGTLRARQISTK